MKKSGSTLILGGCLAVSAIFASAFAQSTQATSESADIKSCKTLLVAQGERHGIVSHGSVGTRIRFPDSIETAVTALPASAWNVEHKQKNLWIRPKFNKELVVETSKVGLTVVLASGVEYDFIVETTNETDISCYFVVDEKTALANLHLDKERRSLKRLKNSLKVRMAELDDREANMGAAYATSFANKQRQIESQAVDAIEAFKFNINTAYSWKDQEGTQSHAKVSSVYDDGQFTYIRVTEIGFGLPIITSRTGEADNTVQYSYSDLTGVYRLNGLFDVLHVKIDESVIQIERKG